MKWVNWVLTFKLLDSLLLLLFKYYIIFDDFKQLIDIDIEKSNKWNFYVTRGGKTANVIVSKSDLGNKYIKTENDGAQPDNLLSLNECQ